MSNDFLSKRVKKRSQSDITTERYEYLSLDQAEPDLGDPVVGPSSALSNVYSGDLSQIYFLGSDSTGTGKRYWFDQSAIVASSSVEGISVREKGVLVGSAGSIKILDFAGDVAVAATTNIGVATITFSAESINYANISGVSTALQNSRTFEITGDIVASPISFDGTGNVSLAATIQPNSVELGTDTTGNYVTSITNGSYITGADGGSESAVLTIGVAATSANTVNQVVARDSSGDFSAGTITADLTGRATIATYADTAGVSTYSTSSGIATYATSSGIATIATYADTAGVSTYSTSSGIATYATSSGIATNIKNGNSGDIPYQTSADTTSFIDASGASAGQVILWNGSNPYWGNIASAEGSSGFTVRDEGSVVGTANSITTINFTGNNVSVVASEGINGIATITVSSGIASSLETARTFEITGDIVASPISFDGTGNVSLAATIQPNSVELGTDTTGNYVRSIGNGSYITGADGGSESADLEISVDATSLNTASKVVARDSSGDFSAGTITANLTGTATTSTNLSDAANITTGTISTSRLSGTYDIDVTTAGYATTAGIATYATTAGVSTYSTSSGIATYATTAGVSTYSTSSGIATYATSSGIATYATTAGIATYATTAGVSTYSTSSGIATYATTAGIATVAEGLTGTPNITVGIITATEFHTGNEGSAIRVTSSTITGPSQITIDPSAVGDNTGSVRIKGDLYVDGTQTIINSTTIELADHNVGIATTVGTNALLDGAGIGIGSTNIRKTISWNNSYSILESSEDFGVDANKQYLIGGESVLNKNTLGSNVVNSSLTSVGTLSSLNVTGNVTASGLRLGDSDYAMFGDGGDLQISHDGTDNHILSPDKDLNIELYPDVSNPKLYIRPTTSTQGITLGGGGGNPVEIYHNNSKKFETTSSGITVTGTVTADGLSLGDSESAYFGTGVDLQIFHDGTDSHIYSLDKDLNIELSPDGGTPKIYIRPTTSTQGITLGGGGENPVEIYHNNAKKFETTSSGITVTGDVIATGGIDGIAIQQGGTNIATGVITALNFLGINNEISFNSGTKTVDITSKEGIGVKFSAGITTSIYTSVSSGVGFNTSQNNDIFVGPGIAYSFPSTSGKTYTIESLHITNTFSANLYFVGVIENANYNTKIPLVNRITLPYQGSVELLDEPIVLNPEDKFRFQALSGIGTTAIGIGGGIDAFFTYSTHNSTDFIGIGTTSSVNQDTEVFTSTSTNGTMLQSIKICNYNMNIDIDASISVFRGGTAGGISTTGTRLGYYAYNITIPKHSAIEILQKPKHLAQGDTIVSRCSSGGLSVYVSGRDIPA